MPIIRSSRVLYRWLLPVVFGALVFKLSVWCGAEGCVSGLAARKPDTQPYLHWSLCVFYFLHLFLYFIYFVFSNAIGSSVKSTVFWLRCAYIYIYIYISIDSKEVFIKYSSAHSTTYNKIFDHYTYINNIIFFIVFTNLIRTASSILLKVKVKVKVTLEQTTKAQMWRKGIALLFKLGARWGGWSTPRSIRFTPGKDPVPIV